jgi:probable phosphoglycerate mutase
VLVYLVRHGESYNTNPLPGETDPANPPLTPVGLAQAECVAERLQPLGISRVFASPMIRTVDTARSIAATLGVPIEVWPRCHEWRETPGYICWGARGLRLHYPDLILPTDFAEDDWEYGNESRAHALERVDDFLEWLKAQATGMGEQRIVVVSHGHFLRVAVGRLLGADPSVMSRVVVDNTAVSTLQISDEGFTVLGLNDTSHLAGLDGLDPLRGITR